MQNQAPQEPAFQVDPNRLIAKYQKQLSALQQQLLLIDTGFEQLQAEYQQQQEVIQMLQNRLAQLEQESVDASVIEANGQLSEPTTHQAGRSGKG